MAEALCGPSNAIQNFKRHTQVDRSLQQDRLLGPRTPVQGFRSQDPRNGSLDADFHAFENASANPFQEPLVGNTFSPQPHSQHLSSSGWATDFQQLKISAQPLAAQEFRHYAPLVKSASGGWHNEFVGQQQYGPMSISQEKQTAFDYQSAAGPTSQRHYQPAFAPLSVTQQAGMSQSHEPVHTQPTHEAASADWAQAFEEAFQSVDQSQVNESASAAMTSHEDIAQASQTLTDVPETERVRIGSDAINYTEKQDRAADQEIQDASALARVAGELLHNVQHDSSQKFQNSQFLDLMRKIRDRQVEVRNNDFESTSYTTGIPTAEPGQLSQNAAEQEVRDGSDAVHQDRDRFAFPDMDDVWRPHEADFVDYTFDSDQFPVQPRSQISDLHPGGKLYPEQSPRNAHVQMSGAVPTTFPPIVSGRGNSDNRSSSPISAADFESQSDESRDLANRFQRTAA